jgi:hypothetical protein
MLLSVIADRLFVAEKVRGSMFSFTFDFTQIIPVCNYLLRNQHLWKSIKADRGSRLGGSPPQE